MIVIERTTMTSPMLEVLAHGSCTLEELVSQCHELTGEKVFLEVARLRRTDKIILYSRGATYTVQLAPSPEACAFCLENWTGTAQ